MPDADIDTSDEPFDADNPTSIAAYWEDATVTAEDAGAAAVRVAKDRGVQKAPRKVLLSVRYSPEVVDYFRSTGKGWQVRMDEALKEYVASRR